MAYTVLVDDNFHREDESHRYELGQYPSYELAVGAAQGIVDRFLAENHKEGMPPEDLFDLYTGFGEDPWVMGEHAGDKFSAWAYAKQRCGEICK